MEQGDQRLRRLQAALAARSQEHVLRWWDHLDAGKRGQLLADLESVPWDLLDELMPTHVLSRPPPAAPHDLQPVDAYRQTPKPGQQPLYEAARRSAGNLLRKAGVAAFTVAGGQGTRLGFRGPKGMAVVTPVADRTLFQLFGDTVCGARERYGAPIPWYVMTSPANHQQTLDYFEQQQYFGLPRGDVMVFPQGMLPALDFKGRLLLEEKHRLALAPDGHGGALRALSNSGALADMRRRGIRVISYFQIDNPLVKPFDPLFLGLHVEAGSEMSTKVAAKADDLERVGNVCLQDGKVCVIEYSEFPEDAARARNPDGSRRFNTGNLAIHLLDVAFVERVADGSGRRPFRRAEKVIPFVDETGTVQQPIRPNGVKLETFIFDVLPFARQPLVLEVDRAEEFSPVKNASGVDSLETSQRDQVLRACRWLEGAGVAVPRRPDGSPDCLVAISPRFALDADEISAKASRIPPIQRGDRLYIE